MQTHRHMCVHRVVRAVPALKKGDKRGPWSCSKYPSRPNQPAASTEGLSQVLALHPLFGVPILSNQCLPGFHPHLNLWLVGKAINKK